MNRLFEVLLPTGTFVIGVVFGALICTCLASSKIESLVEELNNKHVEVTNDNDETLIDEETQDEVEESIPESETQKAEIETTAMAEETKQKAVWYTEEDIDLLSRVIYFEARGESELCQQYVASVVLNRLMYGYWGDTIRDVVLAEGAFTPTTEEDFLTREIPRKYMDLAEHILNYGGCLPREVMFFRDDYDHQWEGYKNYAVVDNMYFGYFEDGGI